MVNYYPSLWSDEEEDPIAIAIHHMTNAAMIGDVTALEDEFSEFLQKYDLNQLNEKQIEQLKLVSLEASMEGHLKCLETVYNWHMPWDELCPVIAAYHGHRNVILFCEKFMELDCRVAWDKYVIWCMKHMLASQNVEQSFSQTMISMKIKSASEWMQEYKQVGGNLLIV